MPRPENAALYRKYQALADATPDVHFVGRLGTYKYYNMDQVVAQALTLYSKIAGVPRRDDRGADMTATTAAPLELWGGVECTVNRVGDATSISSSAPATTARSTTSTDSPRSASRAALSGAVGADRAARRSTRPTGAGPTQRLARLRDARHAPDRRPGAPRQRPRLHVARSIRGFPRAAGALRRGWSPSAIRGSTDYTPVNEPLTTARFSALYGHWYPHARDDRAFVRALLNQMRGRRAGDARDPRGHTRGAPDPDRGLRPHASARARTARQAAFENHRRWLTWDLLDRPRRRDSIRCARYLDAAGATATRARSLRRASPCPPDVVGLNYYLTSDRFLDHRLERYPPRDARRQRRAALRRRRGGAGAAARASPATQAHLLEAWQRYGMPVALTEVHLGCTREEQLRWLLRGLAAARRPRAADGADVGR